VELELDLPDVGQSDVGWSGVGVDEFLHNEVLHILHSAEGNCDGAVGQFGRFNQ
jgi:hypothetical protein